MSLGFERLNIFNTGSAASIAIPRAVNLLKLAICAVFEYVSRSLILH